MEQDKILYSASVTNIASQAVAIVAVICHYGQIHMELEVFADRKN